MAMQIAYDACSPAIDWCPALAARSDAPNLFGVTGVDIDALRRVSGGAGAAFGTSVAHDRYDFDRAKYGKKYLVWTLGATAVCTANIGWNGTTYDIAAQTDNTTYSAAIWVRLQSGAPADTFRFDLMRDNAGSPSVIGSSATGVLTTSWTKLTASGSMTADDELFCRLVRVTGTTTLTVRLTGAMIVKSGTIPAYFNAGADSLRGVLTDDVQGGDWVLGFVKPYQQVAPLGKLSLDLFNRSKRYSPEYASGALYGLLLPGRLLQVADPDHGIWGTYWTDDWQPEPGATGDYGCQLTATDARRFIDDFAPHIVLQERGAGPAPASTWPGFIIDSVLNAAELPAGIANVVGPDIAALGLFALPADPSYETETPLYYADSNEEGTDATRIIADVLMAWQGHFWFNRSGQYEYTSSSANTSIPATDIDALWLRGTAKYETEKIVNSCDVTVKPKRRTGGSVTLWEVDEDIVLAVGETETIRPNFRNLSSGNNGDRTIVGANSLATSGFTLTAGGPPPTHVTVTISEAAAQSCVLTLVNISAAQRTVNAGTITGRKIVALRTYVKNYEDATSITAYGKKAQPIKSEWVSTKAFAKRLGKWLVTRFKDVQYVMRSIELSAEKNAAIAFDATIGTRVTVTDAQTSHSKTYTVIGERHRIAGGVNNHRVTLYLQPEYETTILATSI